MTDSWIPSSAECEGSTSGMFWVTNSSMRGLFKPDCSGKDFIIEETVTKVAEFLCIEHCKVVKATVNNIKGFVSIKKDFKRYEIINGYDLRSDGYSKFNKVKVDSNNLTYPELIDYSLEFFKSTAVFDKLCKVALLDAIVKNCDRHLGNLSFIVNQNKNLVDLYPIYDNVGSLTNSDTENALLVPTLDRMYKHSQVLQYLETNGCVSEELMKYKSESFTKLAKGMECGEQLIKRREELTLRKTNNFSQ